MPALHPVGVARAVGAAVWHAPVAVGRVVQLVLEVVSRAARRLAPAGSEGARSVVWRVTVDQVWYTGVEAVPLVCGLATLVGVTTMGVGFRTLHAFGAEGAFGTVLEKIIAIELAPLLTAVIVAARTGSAICTELLAMRLNDETDALAVHGVDPWVFMGVPRLVGVTLATASLAVAFTATTYAVCLLATVPLGIALPPFAASLADAITPRDVLLLGAKGLCFGLAVAGTTLHRGFTYGRDVSDLPRAGTRGVMDALITVFVLDALFAVLAP
ncbi:MAG: MlaE family ABC transporter permease [Myxococcota bacterium]